ncbi:MAG: hypothetical protein DWC00_01305 [Candidatus Poseidoniales archaeon]|nr:MAG: hypothetical protein DWC00_01305 [Candidatus Poseidoniales archaeon]
MQKITTHAGEKLKYGNYMEQIWMNHLATIQRYESYMILFANNLSNLGYKHTRQAFLHASITMELQHQEICRPGVTYVSQM